MSRTLITRRFTSLSIVLVDKKCQMIRPRSLTGREGPIMADRNIAALVLAALWAQPLAAQHFHRLPATPRTVAYGYYSAAATPVLRIASGDTVEVETLITNRPDRLEAAGVAPADE